MGQTTVKAANRQVEHDEDERSVLFGDSLMEYADALREARYPEDLARLREELAGRFSDPEERELFLEQCEANELLCFYINGAL